MSKKKKKKKQGSPIFELKLHEMSQKINSKVISKTGKKIKNKIKKEEGAQLYTNQHVHLLELIAHIRTLVDGQVDGSRVNIAIATFKEQEWMEL